MVRRGLVFGGQGAHKKGMALGALADKSSRAARAWQVAETRLREAYNISVTSVIRDNLPFAENILIPQVRTQSTGAADPPKLHLEPSVVKHANGVMNLTYLTQPAMLVAAVSSFIKLHETEAPDDVDPIRRYSFVGGHSLGEFSALTAMGIFPIDVAAELVLLRGVLMEHAIAQSSPLLQQRRQVTGGTGSGNTGGGSGAAAGPSFHLVAINPKRAQLEPGFELLSVIVELIGRSLGKTTSQFVEIVNYNEADQFVVAGTPVALSILGKCVDPQFRAQALEKDGAETPHQLVLVAMDSVLRDQQDAIPTDPNTPIAKPTIPGVWGGMSKIENCFQQPEVSMDGGLVLPEEYLSHMTFIYDGRSGLKKKSWFVPINVDVPFHSSILRRAMDNFLPLIHQALPSSEFLNRRLGQELGSSTRWITNLTGSAFENTEEFRAETLSSIRSQNIGECAHSGKYAANNAELERLVNSGDTRDLIAAVMAAQLAHPVMWSDVMLSFLEGGVTEVLEISPEPVLTNMFKRTVTMAREGKLDGDVPGLQKTVGDVSCLCTPIMKPAA